jgi:hypothetical protein
MSHEMMTTRCFVVTRLEEGRSVVGEEDLAIIEALSDIHSIAILNTAAESVADIANRPSCPNPDVNDLIHKDPNIYERMMKPDEYVTLANRQVLHPRKAFEVGVRVRRDG